MLTATKDSSWEALLPPIFAAAGIAAGPRLEVEPLTGGVSSDIVRIRLADGRLYCAKRALSQLKVATEWQAPVERNHYEVAWLRRANAIVPGAAPRVIGEDRAHGIALLEYLPPEDYLLWKTELLAGHADPRVPVAVADALGRIHAATLGDPTAAAEFPTDALIDALRLDPYLRYTAGRHPALADRILAVLASTAGTRLALVHGDVSPKNILVSRHDGHPVLLDAECAWYGDPTFDAAFCLNHLVLKSIHLPALHETLLDQAQAFATAWLGHFPAGHRAGLAARTAALLPCLMLARVDGKSPVEYLTEPSRQVVRDRAMPLIREPAPDLDHLLAILRSSG
ncbi:aminoglycoside phosphotransferase family protein [Devosia sp.]|uniref:phosphotransferase family protein n=1 Tax=Devosia sp. TaxID=1871048 RepID=UPI0025BB4481|nr:aminoglycoside phosphotransferase family protein [Devosia sp.]